jgi:hypothetical protein
MANDSLLKEFLQEESSRGDEKALLIPCGIIF